MTRRLVAAALLLTAVVVPAAIARASASFHAVGIVATVDAQRHVLTIRDSGGDKGLQGHTITVHTTTSTHLNRDGKSVGLAAIRSGDNVDAVGRAGARLVATRVDAVSPPRPDGPAVGAPSECGGYYSPCTPALPPPTASSPVTITIRDFTFDPPVAVVPAGTIVTVQNADPFAHTFSGNHFDSGELTGSNRFSVEFTTPGTYRFFCAIHPFMTGILDVR